MAPHTIIINMPTATRPGIFPLAMISTDGSGNEPAFTEININTTRL